MASYTIDGHRVTLEPGKGWICDCTGVHVERIDTDLSCFHWPLCEHVVKAAALHTLRLHASRDPRSSGESQ